MPLNDSHRKSSNNHDEQHEQSHNFDQTQDTSNNDGGDDNGSNVNNDGGENNKDESLDILWKMINENKKGAHRSSGGNEGEEDLMDDGLSLCSIRDRGDSIVGGGDDNGNDTMSLIPDLGQASLDDM